MNYKTTPTELSNFYLALANTTGSFISNLKLQKLLYYAQAWHLAAFRERFFEGDFEAWIHGPVLPDIYLKFKNYGWKPIIEESLNENIVSAFKAKLNDSQNELLAGVIEEYFGMSGYELERETYAEYPWNKARSGLSPDEPSDIKILDEWMIDYYKNYLVSAEVQEAQA